MCGHGDIGKITMLLPGYGAVHCTGVAGRWRFMAKGVYVKTVLKLRMQIAEEKRETKSPIHEGCGHHRM